MKTDKNLSREHLLYLKKRQREKLFIITMRAIILTAFLLFWEVLARAEIIDGFITSYPSEIALTIVKLFKESNLLYHIGVTLWETLLGFLISVVFGYLIALILWWSERLRKIFEPYIVVLNSLPKIALGPIIIIWFGSGEKAIIAMTVLISIIVCILTMVGGFLETDKEKLLLMRSFGANKLQIKLKLVIPSSLASLINMLKIGMGMAWIGSIMGEYLVSKAGLGYLIVYGGQVFKLDLVMASTVVLLALSGIMYALIALAEKLIIKR
jgi:NitT/TauT family transport system permease protein